MNMNNRGPIAFISLMAALIIGAACYAGYEGTARINRQRPLNSVTVTLGMHVLIGKGGDAGTVIAIKPGGPESPALITVRIPYTATNSRNTLYSEATFLATELYVDG